MLDQKDDALARRRQRPGDRPRQERREPADPLRRRASTKTRSCPPRAPAKPLTPEQVGILRAWIDQGATWPDDAEPSRRPRRRPLGVPPPGPARAARRSRTRPGPATRSTRFVLARLEREGLEPSPEADRATLIRRLSLDLIGLPPTIAEVDAFVADTSPDAYEKLVDRLLASPHYGERWARRWLDLARYADTNGYEKDRERSIWPYRDWVIDALNADMPFDQFTVEQIAGDLLPGRHASTRRSPPGSTATR